MEGGQWTLDKGPQALGVLMENPFSSHLAQRRTNAQDWSALPQEWKPLCKQETGHTTPTPWPLKLKAW